MIKCFVTIFQRYSWAIPLCKDLTDAGLEVILIDNHSTFPPCVEWLNNCGYKIERREINNGAWAFDKTELCEKYKDRFYFLCDSDIDISMVPKDFPEHLMRGLENSDPEIWKVGLSFEINDLPDNVVTRQAFIHESAFWNKEPINGFHKAWIDIGCTLHDREKKAHWYSTLRADRPYTAKHLDWHLSKETWRAEDEAYLKDTEEYYGWCRKWYDEVYLNKPPK
jgi:hypothetical protein